MSSDDEYMLDPSLAAPSPGMAQRTRRRRKEGPLEELKGAGGGYAWELEIQRLWDVVKEDDGGLLDTVVHLLVSSRKKRQGPGRPLQRGIIRALVVVLDLSENMLEKDLRPTRHQLAISHLVEFVADFFDQNPIAQLAVVVTRAGVAHLALPLSGSPQEHMDVLRQLRKLEPKGDASLQNALELSRGVLMHVAKHCLREVLVVYGALSTTDPGDIHDTASLLVELRVTVRIIGLAAQVAVCQAIVARTNHGADSAYGVILNETHFKELLAEAVTPLAVVQPQALLVHMGFPSRVSETPHPLFCACHGKLTYGGYHCPQCQTKVCLLPNVCPLCGLMLILLLHLARSYHHLFPLKEYAERELPPGGSCFLCHSSLPGKRLVCPACSNGFCIDCDVFAHEVLHVCPGCELHHVG